MRVSHITVAGGFTADEQLRVQMEIERRAHGFWRDWCRRQFAALENCLQAEREVLEEFIRSRFTRHQPALEPRPLRKAEDKKGDSPRSGENLHTDHNNKA